MLTEKRLHKLGNVVVVHEYRAKIILESSEIIVAEIAQYIAQNSPKSAQI